MCACSQVKSPSLATLTLSMLGLVLYFHCLVTTAPTPSTPGSTQHWERSCTSSQGCLQFTNIREIYIATLEVNSATLEDQGVYVCRAITQNNIIVNQTISALILDPVQVMTESMLTYEARLCEIVVLNCTALYHESIIWSMKAYDQTLTILNSIDGRITILSGTGQLVISEAKLSDNGTYGCAASNRVSSQEIVAYLHIGKRIIIIDCKYVHDLMHVIIPHYRNNITGVFASSCNNSH